MNAAEDRVVALENDGVRVYVPIGQEEGKAPLSHSLRTQAIRSQWRSRRDRKVAAKESPLANRTDDFMFL